MWLPLLIFSSHAYPCVFTSPDGTQYDLSVFTRAMPDYEADSMDFVYRLNVCTDALKYCNGEAGIAVQFNYNSYCVAVLARQGPVPPALTKTVDGIMLTYTNGDPCFGIPRKVNYIFHCSESDTRVGLEIEPELCIYNFDFYSKDACFYSQSFISSSWFIWLAYIAGFLFVLYFLGGLVYNKFQDKELGIIEAIPHSEKILECLGRGNR